MTGVGTSRCTAAPLHRCNAATLQRCKIALIEDGVSWLNGLEQPATRAAEH
jgi:hypothetical protein